MQGQRLASIAEVEVSFEARKDGCYYVLDMAIMQLVRR